MCFWGQLEVHTECGLWKAFSIHGTWGFQVLPPLGSSSIPWKAAWTNAAWWRCTAGTLCPWRFVLGWMWRHWEHQSGDHWDTLIYVDLALQQVSWTLCEWWCGREFSVLTRTLGKYSSSIYQCHKCVLARTKSRSISEIAEWSWGIWTCLLLSKK